MATNNALNNSSSPFDVDNLHLETNTISSTDTNGDLNLTPDGTGTVIVGTDLDVGNLNLATNTLSSTDTNGNIILAPDGTGVVQVTNAPVVPSGDRAESLGSATNSWDNVYADGITFDDGGNVLSIYEVGTWTPAMAFGGGTTGITYATQTGNYVRIGSLIFINCSVHLSSVGSSTGVATLTGLPYASATATMPLNIENTNQITYAGTMLEMLTSGGTTSLRFYTYASGGPSAQLTHTAFGSSADFKIAGCYII